MPKDSSSAHKGADDQLAPAILVPAKMRTAQLNPTGWLHSRTPSSPVIGFKLVSPECTIMVLIPDFRDLVNLHRRQLECHDPQVVAHPLLFGTRRDWHDTLVDAPPQQDLPRTDGIFPSK